MQHAALGRGNLQPNCYSRDSMALNRSVSENAATNHPLEPGRLRLRLRMQRQDLHERRGSVKRLRTRTSHVATATGAQPEHPRFDDAASRAERGVDHERYGHSQLRP